MYELKFSAEDAAVAATELSGFNRINLAGIKEAVGEILRLIGMTGPFREYTTHDITHVDGMLAIADDLIPPQTREAMTPVDWLLLVLSIYFHDMGLLVTKGEYEARGNSDFEEYCASHLFIGDDGAEYRSQAEALAPETEEFLYQEFVRAHHAERIGLWVRGRRSSQYGEAAEAVDALDELLGALPDVFRDDLALVCESHHRNDLDNTERYPVRQPYGASDAATANVQYTAILLRSCDLLHITSDRTPSIAFRFINPQDPASQREWAKQKAVRKVQPQLGFDQDGNLSEDAPRDTLTVFARFEDADGFFGLMAYLRYAREQLQQSFDVAKTSQVQLAVTHSFPWRRIDDSQITANGFLPRQLSFTLDQSRILDLLTGHTLYNDSRVVARELLQNSLDAVRLQAFIEGCPESEGEIAVEWSSGSRELVVRDNGTGMTQAIIENNLLKAGASRYQEESFIERHPDFSPISKFGIGVLSAFMVANEVEVLTATDSEAQATRLRLRSVHDRYLVSLLDKESDPDARRVAPHGTEVRLRVRDTAEFPDVLDTVRHWVLVPRCAVNVTVDGGDAVAVGYSSCAEALERVLREFGVDLFDESEEVLTGTTRVISAHDHGVETAVATRWNSAFREWSIVSIESFTPGGLGFQQVLGAVGACIEGVRVETGSPGFVGPSVIALCNAVGKHAPKTNVARSGLEPTPARAAMMRRVYDAYIGHVADELRSLSSDRGFSTTWAAQEAEYMLLPLVSPNAIGEEQPHMEPLSFRGALAAQPLIVIEDEDGRRLVSGSVLDGEQRLWTVDSAFVRAGESLLREVPNDSSLRELATTLGTNTVALPDGTTLIGFRAHSSIWSFLLTDRQVGRVIISRDERRLDMGWDRINGEPRWLSLGGRSEIPGIVTNVLTAVRDPEIVGGEREVAVRSHGRLFLFSDSAIAEYILRLAGSLPVSPVGANVASAVAFCVDRYFRFLRVPEDLERWVRSSLEQPGRMTGIMVSADDASSLVRTDDLVEALRQTPISVFDTSAWRREEMDQGV